MENRRPGNIVQCCHVHPHRKARKCEKTVKAKTYNMQATAEGNPEENGITAHIQFLHSLVVHLGGSDPDEELQEVGDQDQEVEHLVVLAIEEDNEPEWDYDLQEESEEFQSGLGSCEWVLGARVQIDVQECECC